MKKKTWMKLECRKVEQAVNESQFNDCRNFSPRENQFFQFLNFQFLNFNLIPIKFLHMGTAVEIIEEKVWS